MCGFHNTARHYIAAGAGEGEKSRKNREEGKERGVKKGNLNVPNRTANGTKTAVLVLADTVRTYTCI